MSPSSGQAVRPRGARRTTPLGRLAASRDVFAHRVSEVDGCRMLARCSVVGPRRADPPLVLIGGTALSGRYLLPVAVELAHRYPVWVPDLPGRGASEAPQDVLSVEGYADHLLAWMARAGLDRAAVLGNSMGCQIAVEMAVRAPERISSLVLQGPTTDASARTMPRQLLRLLRAGRHEPLSLAPVEALDWVRVGLVTAFASARAALEHRVEEQLPRVTCPVLVVRGALDPIAPPDWARQVTALLPDGRLRVVPGAGHSMVYTNALELARVTDAFLQGR
jgi:2-hydroxy-6-oxonona-2,4-dienedioate hydrolase